MLVTLPLIDGSITKDGSAEIYATFEATLAPRFSNQSQVLAPSGAVFPRLTAQGEHDSNVWPNDVQYILNVTREVYIESATIAADGTITYVPQGIFRVYNMRQTNAETIRITGSDRTALLKDSKIPFPSYLFTIPYVEVLVQKFQGPAVYPWYPTPVYNFPFHSKLLYRDIVPDAKPQYDIIKDICDAFGFRVYFNNTGTMTIGPVPDGSGAAIWTLDYGQALISRERSLSREGAYNGVKAFSSDPEVTGVYAVAVDNDSKSPTYWNGPFGRVVKEYASPFLYSVAQAQSAALAQLSRTLGVRSKVDIELVPNPLLEPFDIIQIWKQDDPTTYDKHQIESVVIPLGEGTMKLTTKAQNFGGQIITE